MKKCPECGNPSYDGAPACGNCGYKFPKMKPSAPKKEIFDKAPEKKKKQFSDEESTIEIILLIFTPIILLISFAYMVVSIINYVSPILSLMQSLTGN